MVRTHQLLAQKYSLSADNIGSAVNHHLQLDAKTAARFVKALEAWRNGRSSATRDRLLDAALTVLEELQKIILSPAPSVAVENIYQKRHIAAGIPSMYGNYTEPKFDALGLSFRVERLVAILLDDLVSRGVEPYVTRDTLRRMAAAIRRFERALAADGVDSRNLGANLRLLESSFSSHNFTFHQYQNVFQFFMGSVTAAVPHLHPQPRPGAAHRAQARPPAVRGPVHVHRRGRRDGAARGPGVGAGDAVSGPLHVHGAAADLHAHREAEQPRAHPHDELRPGAPGVAHPQAQARAPTTR